MLRSLATTLAVAVVTLACSDSTSPRTAARPGILGQALPPHAIPYVAGVHTAAIPAFNNPALSPVAFNDWGEIVGDSGGITVFKWQSQRGLVTLPLPVDSFASATAAAVNDQGQVAITLGDSRTSVGIWDWSGHVTVRRSLARTAACTAFGLNDSGVVVGACSGGGLPSSVATLWTRAGNPDTLHGPNGFQVGELFAISNAAYIVGYDGLNAFTFTPNRTERFLPPTNRSVPSRGPGAINDSGWVAGMAFNPNIGAYDGAVWTTGGALQDLGLQGQTLAVSNDGIAVGGLQDTTVATFVPIIWTRNTGLQRLPPLEGGAGGATEAGEAIAINSHHQILGFVMPPGGRRWVIWTLPF